MQNSLDTTAEFTAPMRDLRRVLIIEDEGLLAMMMEDQMRDLGAEQVEVCRDGADALRLAAEIAFDCAVLDVSLGGGTSYAVADILVGRGIPFLFCTGMQREDIEERHRHRPVLAKPYGDGDLRAALAEALGVAG